MKEWKLFSGAKVKHVEGSVWVLTIKGSRGRSYVVQNDLGEPISPNVNQLTPKELRAIAAWKDADLSTATIGHA